MIHDQDRRLGDVIDVVKGTKYEGQNMKQELEEQMPMLNRLDRNIEVADANMIVVDNQMKKLMKKTNQWVLWGVLIVELVIMILLLAL